MLDTFDMLSDLTILLIRLTPLETLYGGRNYFYWVNRSFDHHPYFEWYPLNHQKIAVPLSLSLLCSEKCAFLSLSPVDPFNLINLA